MTASHTPPATETSRVNSPGAGNGVGAFGRTVLRCNTVFLPVAGVCPDCGAQWVFGGTHECNDAIGRAMVIAEVMLGADRPEPRHRGPLPAPSAAPEPLHVREWLAQQRRRRTDAAVVRLRQGMRA